MNLTKEMIQNMRQDYKAATLNEQDVDKDPVKQFANWFNEAIEGQLCEPNAMTLATVDKNNKPSARIVLLKGFDAAGFTFFTNYLSRKGRELKKNPHACLVFYWGELERQVRIEGKIEKLVKEASEAYFNSRPKGSQVSAVVSPQSQVIDGRKGLEEKIDSFTKENENNEIQKPAHWGGYILKPTNIEFWQGRSNRLHDRITFQLTDKSWKIERLAP